MSAEKRKFPRADVVFKLNYSVNNSGVASEGRNLSGGGVSFLTDKLHDSGTEFRLAFSLDGLPGEIEAVGRVIRSWEEDGKNFAAVEFLKIDQNDRVIVMDFINTYLKQS